MISEKDLFDFVFYPELLSDEMKQKIISSGNLEEYKTFYQNLKEELDRGIDDEFKRIIAERIPAFSSTRIIVLHPVVLNITRKPAPSRLTAASVELEPSLTMRTFVDSEKEYLIKVLTEKDQTRIFVFSTKVQAIRNFDIVITPGNLSFHMDDNSAPLLIDSAFTADMIEIRFL